MKMLSILRKNHRFELKNYYMNSGALSLVYEAETFPASVDFFCIDKEYALEKVSGGKCKLQEQTRTSTEVMCNV